MKGLETLIRVRKWELDEKRKAVTNLQKMQDYVQDKQQQLEQEIITERQRASENLDVAHTFSAYHQHAMIRREQLQADFDALTPKIEAAREEMAQAFQNVKQFEQVKESLDAEAAAELAAIDAERMDEIGLNLHRRQQNEP